MKRNFERAVVVGAGLAGAATAFGLVRRGVRNVLVLEQESIPGYYASGRNAAMIRQLGTSSVSRRLVRQGISFFARPPAPFPGTVGFAQSGSLLLASGKECEALRSWVENDGAQAADVRFLSPSEVDSMIGSALARNFEVCAHTSTDGVVDVHGLLHGFLAGIRSAGGEVRYGTRVVEVTTRGGRIAAVKTGAGQRVECDLLVNAAGPWAGKIGELAGAMPLRALTLRRHLALSGPLPGVRPEWPIVWNITSEVYFRPESGGVLFSPCDEDAIEPCDPPMDEAAIGLLAQKVSDCFPGLRDAEMRRSWACIRTFAPDRRIVLGEDPRVGGFIWAACLGGNGVGLAPMLSELMADLILDGRTSLLSEPEQREYSSSRFA